MKDVCANKSRGYTTIAIPLELYERMNKKRKPYETWPAFLDRMLTEAETNNEEYSED